MLDRIDLSILSHLQIDGRKSYTEIAKAIGVTEGTVRKRAARLIEGDVIRIIGLVDPHRVGFEAPAIIQVNVAPPHLESAAKTIKTTSKRMRILTSEFAGPDGPRDRRQNCDASMAPPWGNGYPPLS